MLSIKMLDQQESNKEKVRYYQEYIYKSPKLQQMHESLFDLEIIRRTPICVLSSCSASLFWPREPL